MSKRRIDEIDSFVLVKQPKFLASLLKIFGKENINFRASKDSKFIIQGTLRTNTIIITIELSQDAVENYCNFSSTLCAEVFYTSVNNVADNKKNEKIILVPGDNYFELICGSHSNKIKLLDDSKKEIYENDWKYENVIELIDIEQFFKTIRSKKQPGSFVSIELLPAESKLNLTIDDDSSILSDSVDIRVLQCQNSVKKNFSCASIHDVFIATHFSKVTIGLTNSDEMPTMEIKYWQEDCDNVVKCHLACLVEEEEQSEL